MDAEQTCILFRTADGRAIQSNVCGIVLYPEQNDGCTIVFVSHTLQSRYFVYNFTIDD